MKTPILVAVLLAIIGAAGFYGWQQYRAFQAAQTAQAAHKAAAAQLQAKAAVSPADAKKQAAENATRQEIETALKPLKVTSILPGQPGIVIIDKHAYAEGEDLPVGKGRVLRVAQVQEERVILAGAGLSFHLDAPAAPDLDASRKH